ncbi:MULTISPECIES: TetR/AcrR family transcriptional regulator [unclassified Arthrobacter]|uniref:TetR/AcrR family transcriptional regulator n=1 Tax=unclassified Arthrobacter TaxID=235627 RepID=UPI001491CC80|nr:TetR/AcrR family transcriptional regulator [Arthrobacter sp. AET 35A]MBE0008564.1 TetR/AcrR family transcriptional regulator [Arthrobacter sp. AET 35A]NOJ62304.1 TetR/AcrR family transcriptional regulator [Arthrobacter sp. 147(2020)]
MTEQSSPRTTYRHGDLRRALIDAGTGLAREGGPDAVVLREVTRRAGVTPNAAYRHFTDKGALLWAVSLAAQSRLAAAMEDELSAIDDGARQDDAVMARARLRAVGAGYLRFAQTEPGLFRTAFANHVDLRDAATGDSAGPHGRTPFQLLSDALDALVDAGVLPADRRAGAEFVAWSSVHGLAMLVIDGPLRGLDPDQRLVAAQRLLEMVEKGI